ncbi:hypothetical protein WA577_006138, partial [Blastocystis sp. JDR]
MRNLPKLTSLTTTSNSWSFRYANHITLYDIPALTNVTLPRAFGYKKYVSTNCNIGELKTFFTKQCTVKECWGAVPLNVEVITVGDNKCNGENERIDLSKYVNLKNVSIGNDCFFYQDVLNLTGLHSLERVMIGENSFTKKKNSSGNDANRKLYVKNCDALKELKIGRFSFSDYSLIEIENVNSLELIEMGEVNRESNSFAYASLELKNLPKLKSLLFGYGAFLRSSRLVLENLPELTSIRLGDSAFQLYSNVESSTLVMRNLPKLTSLTTTSDSYSFRYPRHITLYDIPALTNVTLPNAFRYKNDVSTNCNIGKLADLFPSYCVTECWSDTPVPLNVEVITVGNGKCNEDNDRIDLSKYVNLKNVSIGNECFFYQDVLNLTGLHSLERVMIGMNSFTMKKNYYENDANRKLYVKNCDALKELKIGGYSFSDYSLIEIENVNSLELIEMGEVNNLSFNFYFASLELKNLPKLKSLLFGQSAFCYSSRLVLENLPELTSIQLGYSAFQFSNVASSTLVMRNLPKLTSLTTTPGSNSFRYPHHITLYDIPALTTVSLSEVSFEDKRYVSTNCNIGELYRFFTDQCTANECWSVTPVPLNVEVITVGDGMCNEENDRIDLSKYVNLKNVSIGNECFKNQDVLNLTGLHSLERVMIGENSFTKKKNSSGNDANRKLYVKNCDALKELKIGRFSFSDYSVIEIENVNSLELIEMGDMNNTSNNFFYASLELKNLPKLKSLLFGNNAFSDSCRLVLENLPELTSIQLGHYAFYFNEKSSTLVMRNLPKLTTLTTTSYSWSFRFPYHITLYDIPALTTVTLPYAFFYKKYVSTNCNIGKLADLFPSYCVTECWGAVPLNVEVITVGTNKCNEENDRIDLSKYVNLKNVSIGNECFKNQDVLNLTGLHSLERVMIGMNSFTMKKNDYGNDANRKLFVKNCDALKELKIGSYSFSDYSLIEIENVNSLELIEMGEVNNTSNNFYFASLELKNLPKLKSLLFGYGAFCYSSRLVLENLPELTSIRLGFDAFYFDNDVESSTLIMRNLPKLTTLTTTSNSWSFRYANHITLYDIPALTTVSLSEVSFEDKKYVSTNCNISKLKTFFTKQCP